MGSLFSALTTAVSGLNAQSSSIGNISDNLANAQTTGYKAVGTSFIQLVNASNATTNNPGGVRAKPSYQNDVQGSITNSNTGTSLAISGEGYFAVETATTDSNGSTIFSGQILYTRQGDFTLDKDGYLVNGSGYYLTGYAVDGEGTVNTSSTGPIQVSALLDNPVPTGEVSYNANLPSNASIGYTSATSTVLVYDALGNTHAVNYTWEKTATNAWDLVVDIPDADDSNNNAYNTTIAFTFNDGSGGTTAGTIGSITAYAAGTASPPPSPYSAPGTQTTGSLANVDVALTFPGAAPQTVALAFGDFGGSLGVTQFSDTNAIVTVTNFNQDGLPRGSFNSLSIDKNGLVAINYSNGTNRVINQVPLVQFYAQDQLQRVTGGAYQATLASGNPRYSAPGATGAGTISSSSLEQSNVDIATEFTTLIQAQQVYSANAKVVTTDNSLLQITTNMVQ